MKGPNSRVCKNRFSCKKHCTDAGPSRVCREQFSIPQATPAYDDIVRQLPSEFVGPASSSETPFPASFPHPWQHSLRQHADQEGDKLSPGLLGCWRIVTVQSGGTL